MAILGNYERGIDTQTLTLFKQNVRDDGLLSNDQNFISNLGGGGVGLSLYAEIESVRTRTGNRLVNLSPMTRRQRNMVPVETGTTMTFAGLILKGSPNGARNIGFYADYVVAVWVENECQWTFTGVVEMYEQDVNKEGSRFTLSLEHVDDLSVSGNIINNPDLTGAI